VALAGVVVLVAAQAALVHQVKVMQVVLVIQVAPMEAAVVVEQVLLEQMVRLH
jgi:hypothetical protein